MAPSWEVSELRRVSYQSILGRIGVPMLGYLGRRARG